MTSRLQKHLVAAHNFTEDSWRVTQAPVRTHQDDHDTGAFQHPEHDLYLYIEDWGQVDDR